MEDVSYYGSTNARLMEPEDVARKFVPIPQFQRLIHSTHSLLLGPRGSGKTTLLKMLTARAISTWKNECEKDYEVPPFQYPQFEAIYVPSDIRWSYELSELVEDKRFHKTQTQLIQRVMVSASVLIALIETFERITQQSSKNESDITIELIKHWQIENTVPIFRDIRNSIEKIVIDIRAGLNYGDSNTLDMILKSIPQLLYAHSLDLAITSCNLFAELIGDELPFTKWALCYDELEIAPEWLRKEMLESLRSVDQRFLLKLTWSPLLPTGLKSVPELADDYLPIRLWHSHIQDANKFCENLTSRFLKVTFPNSDITPDQFFSYSSLARDEKSEEEKNSYKRGSTFYKIMKNYVLIDPSFREKLNDYNIDPEDPYTNDEHLLNTFFRKIKPIVLLRDFFLEGKGKRSRKAITLYAGKQTIYAMSEGNPRWLLGLLTDLYDRWSDGKNFTSGGIPKITYVNQAKTLNNSSRRFQSFLSAIDSGFSLGEGFQRSSLYAILEKVGDYFNDEILDTEFPMDPSGSFFIDKRSSNTLKETITKALEIGAIIYVGKSDEDVPSKIDDSRFRLTFMLAPIFKLPFRNYREVSFNSIMRKTTDAAQLEFFFQKTEDEL